MERFPVSLIQADRSEFALTSKVWSDLRSNLISKAPGPNLYNNSHRPCSGDLETGAGEVGVRTKFPGIPDAAFAIRGLALREPPAGPC